MTTRRSYKEEALPVIEPVIVRHRRIRDDAEMDITPMIDITFLLLIFFLVASRMDDAASLELPPARHGEGISIRDAAILTLVAKGDSAAIFKGDGAKEDTAVQAADPAAQELEIGEYVERLLTGESPKQHVLIKAESNVPHREVSRVARAVGKATDALLFFAVLEEG